LKIYPTLNLQEPSIPQRSTLYSLEPIGIGTPFSESLTSYISRLAEAHCVPLGELYLNIISPQLGKDVSSARSRSIERLLGSSTTLRPLNGRGKCASNMLEVIEDLTLCKQLHLLTLLNWTNLLSDKGLLCPIKTWCPICFQAWRDENKLIYEPLIWFLNDVKFCFIHQFPLQELCHLCHQKSRIVEWKSRLGHCSKCQKWLGNTSKEIVQSLDNLWSKNELKFNLWITNSIGELVSSTVPILTPYPRENIKNSISICIDSLGGIASFARFLKTDFSKVQDWYTGKRIPKFSTILYICYSLQVSLLAFMSGLAIEPISNKLASKQQCSKNSNKAVPRKTARKRMKNDELQQVLLAALEENPPAQLKEVLSRLGYTSYTVTRKHFPELGKKISDRYAKFTTQKWREELKQKVLLVIDANEYPPPSLQEVCRRIGANNSTLYLHFSDLCTIISSRYKNYLQLRKNNRTEAVCQQIREIAIKLHEKGRRPTSMEVGKLLDKPGLLRERVVGNALFEIQRELGYRT
jgi:hypothetical protein